MTVALDATHDAATRSWVESAEGHEEFPLQNLPLGVVSPPSGEPPRGGVRIGEHVLDLARLAGTGLLTGLAQDAAAAGSGPQLQPMLALGAPARRALRVQTHALLTVGARDAEVVRACLHALADCQVHLPTAPGNYTDFYAGIHHARNVGALFRPDAPLLPNYDWVPIGYHGRASTVQASGTPVHRPHGQSRPDPDAPPVFGPSARLDLELELGAWIGTPSTAGRPVPVGGADAHVAGYCLLNDWSARDLQAWEYQPLGPFLSKSFATTVSPWIVTPEALAPFRTGAMPRGGAPAPLPHLHDERDQADGGLDVELEVLLTSERMRAAGLAPMTLATSSTRHLYWTVAQLVAHHTSNGCDLRAGDLLGSGTLSGPEPHELGSLLEITRGGKEHVALPTGETRTFLQDGDEVVLRGRARRDGYASVGFGECRGVVVPALA